MPREYPPAVLVHSEVCEDVSTLRRHGDVLIPTATPDLARAYPNGRMHSCYHFSVQARGVVQTMTYPPHAYEPSTVRYPDATRALCVVCMGTHGTLDALILPPGAQGR
ncbi:MAG: hypothetical protein QOH97_2787 [Actinoplanes sp.]|jgi:hypothetical protein|nr:hypothetical protein [Actinoplanes sp.]